MFQRFFGRSERPDKGAGALPARLTFDGFLRTSPGRLLLEWEAEAYDELTVDVFGSCALQIGMPELNTLAEKSYAVEVADRTAEYGFRFRRRLKRRSRLHRRCAGALAYR